MLQVESTPKTAGEKETLLAFLNNQRAELAWKVRGLPLEEVKRPMVPSGTSLLGVARHMACVELYWFGDVIAGGDYEVPAELAPWWQLISEIWESGTDPDADFRILEGETVDQILGFYELAVGVANDIVARTDLDRVGSLRDVSLRWVLVHMIEETARHAGHADILREQLDGLTGYMPS
jgi:hypothetical protein